jgi:hypothetical protein
MAALKLNLSNEMAMQNRPLKTAGVNPAKKVWIRYNKVFVFRVRTATKKLTVQEMPEGRRR